MSTGALAITRTDAIKAIHKARRLDTMIARGKEHQEELAHGLVRTVVGSGTALGLGLLNGAGHGEIFGTGIPWTLGAGVTAHGLRLLAIFSGSRTASKITEPLNTVGDVGLWTYLFATGVGLGSEHWGGGRKSATRGTMGGDFADQLRDIANMS
jgi:hypothetical protein